MAGHGDAQRIINVIRQAIKQETGNAASIEHSYGTIASISTDGTVSAYLNGNLDSTSDGFRLPSGVRATAGAPARFAVNRATGAKWVEEIIPTTVFPKIVLDPLDGHIYTNDGQGNEKQLTFLIWAGVEIIYANDGSGDEFIWQ